MKTNFIYKYKGYIKIWSKLKQKKSCWYFKLACDVFNLLDLDHQCMLFKRHTW